MDKRHQPQYDKALEQPNRRKIVQAIAQEGGTAKFSTICKRTSIKDNTLLHHLNVLIEYGIIEQIADGPYALRYKTPLGFILNEKAPEKERCVYFGLLGDRRERDEPETKIALELLKKQGIEVNLGYVVTSSAAAQSWKNSQLPVQWILVDGDAIMDIDKIRKRIESILTDLIKEHMVIMDCTSFNKPATIALYQLAEAYLIPLIYIYEPRGKLKWLISKQSLSKRLGI